MAPKAISPWPSALMTIMAGSTRSRKSRSHMSASMIRHRPISRQSLGAVMRRLGQQLGQPHQVVGGGREGEGQFDPLQAAELGLALARPRS